MPVTIKKRGDRYRIVEEDGGKLVMSRGGKPVDGGGHVRKRRAGAQVAAINMNMSSKKK